MIYFPETTLEEAVIHRVGNRTREEGVHLSKSNLKLDDTVANLLKSYFLTPFKSNELFNLHHESSLEMNEVFNYVSKIFDDPDLLYDQSVNLANHLYEKSTHPKVKEGEFYVVYFKSCFIDEEEADAVGIFKSETKDTFLKIFLKNDVYGVDSEDGININKLDKGCLIFNTEKDRGYVVAVVDNLSKGSEAQYWKDEFLKICQRNDNFFQTQEAIKLCKKFVIEKMPEEFEVNKAEQAELLTKSFAYFKEKDDFSFEEFKQDVIQQPQLIESFNDFKINYEEEYDLKLPEEIKIEDSAVKKEAKNAKNIIKLDKNFHIYVHGGRDYIVKGYDDERRMDYYTLYFREEK